MDTVELFYTPPKDECFEELKSLCIRFWECFSEFRFWDEKQEELEREYRQTKISQIKNLENTGNNFIFMVQMIHPILRISMAQALSLETRNEISMRLYGWENDNENDPFNIWNIKNNTKENF